MKTVPIRNAVLIVADERGEVRFPLPDTEAVIPEGGDAAEARREIDRVVEEQFAGAMLRAMPDTGPVQ